MITENSPIQNQTRPSRFSVQHWLERTAWGTLKGTKFGVPPEADSVPDCIDDDPLLRQVYLIDLATFIVNERLALDCVAGAIQFCPEETWKIAMAGQALDEARHLEVFTNRAFRLGLTQEKLDAVVERYTTPEMRRFHDCVREQVDKGDFFAATLAINVMLEGLAGPVYKYESKYWSVLDPAMSRLIVGAFQDEAQHVGFGEETAKAYLLQGRIAKPGLRKLVEDLKVQVDDIFHAVVRHYIGLYQEAANNWVELTGHVEIFPGRKIYETSEEEQVDILLAQVEQEYGKRLSRIGLGD